VIRRPLASLTKVRSQALRAASVMLAISWCVSCVGGSNGVTRMADGVRYQGRFINPEAYAAYLLGVEYEARGNFKEALRAYLDAHTEDPDSPEIWARIGAVRCFSSELKAGPAAARAAFERGLQLDAGYPGSYLERARCAERAGGFKSALTDATAAVARRPQDESANLLVARALSALGQQAEARAWLEAYRSYYSATIASERALASARAPGSPPTAAAPDTSTNSAPASTHSAAFSELRSGKAERARQRAQIELDADPTNTDAWIATLIACDALHDDACFESTLSRLRTPSLSPSGTALGYLRELLARRAGVPISF
jgi:tetratricopeptide (TPR) repeat protein